MAILGLLYKENQGSNKFNNYFLIKIKMHQHNAKEEIY